MPLPALAGGCTAPPELVKLEAPLPKFLAAVHSGSPIRVVALGSSSTWGKGASSRTHTYPARLEQELRAAWPKSDVRVINAGVNGQLARHMLARIDTDVAPHKPQLVLWQTGVNDAIRGVAIDTYREQLRTGITRFRGLGADVVLIDQQFYPRFTKVKNGPLYMATLREVAGELRVPVMKRFAIMQHLIASAQFTAASLLSSDEFHLNDRSYDCIGRLLAQSLRSAAAPIPPPPRPAMPAAAVPPAAAPPAVKVVAPEDAASM
ncbi:SGNH/GDSL hydrolase family protein [Hyphomicrobium sp.]|uniref:SGNH/GDSL hydrolase family protein n=1 Tax=Hyphomicrobium sp. TaxID=82 RepID=UPI0025C24707|nr:SGNH/GDSL hydrolase family protein [Hyphomicrobium sp.]MCC7250244.1 SGNH/GDSL hydrolase family protein [Hyphomicrobium sp.]